MLSIGSVGVMQDDQFVPRGSAKSLLDVQDLGPTTTGQRANWQLTSGSDVAINFLGDGEASTLFPKAPKLNAKIEVSFARDASFFVNVTELTVETLQDPAALIGSMVDAYQRGVWRDDYVLVYETITPKNTLLLLSRSSQSNFLLAARGNATAPQGTVDLAGKVGLTFQNRDALYFDVGGQPLFFNAYRVKRDWWTDAAQVEAMSLGDSEEMFEVA
jgi:hypothetical protein